ncbi:MAG: LytR family transcriptional regulator [Ruminococcaceae bacterium]|nr:LytR family transcriptional regulator [Oscillospiraceae bacterium]
MSEKKTYKSEQAAETAKKRRKKKKRNPKKTLVACLLCIAIIGVMIFTVDRAIGNMYNVGEEIPEDLTTDNSIDQDVVNILVCGIDWDDSRTAKMTDVIVYVSLDVKAGRVNLLQIPRDTYVGEPSGTGKINAVYKDGDEKNQIMNVVKTLNQRFGLTVDHYVTVDMDSFTILVDHIEHGLNMYVPCPIILKDGNGNETTLYSEAGWYTVDGATAEAILRNRNYPDGDVSRLAVQSAFYASLLKHFKEVGVVVCAQLVPTFAKFVTTDMHWTRMVALVTEVLNIDFSNMQIIKPSVHGYVADGQAIVTVEEEEWLRILNENFRPYQEPVTDIVTDEPGEITQDYGATETTTQTIGGILAGAGE